MAVTKTYYEILGVAKDANAEEINKAYRKLSLQYHPDRNPGDAEALEKFKEVNDANGILGDEAKRREYDRTPREAVSAYDVAYFKSRPDYARLTLREFQENGYIEFARIKKTFWRGRGYSGRVNLHCNPRAPALALEEFCNALTALGASRVAVAPKNLDDKAIVSFNIDNYYAPEIQDLVELIERWKGLISQPPELPQLPAAENVATKASGATKRVSRHDCPTYEQRCTRFADDLDMLGLHNPKYFKLGQFKPRYSGLVVHDTQDQITQALRENVHWELVGPKRGKTRYAVMDLTHLPPIKGIPPDILKNYYKYLVARYLNDNCPSGLQAPEMLATTFCPIDQSNGKLTQRSDYYAVVDLAIMDDLGRAGIIPKNIAQAVHFSSADENQICSSIPSEDLCANESEYRNLLENMESDPQWKNNAIKAIKDGIRWTLKGPKDSHIKYATADFSDLPPLPRLKALKPEVLRVFYKCQLKEFIGDNLSWEQLRSMFCPIDPNTGEPKEGSDHYAIMDRAVFEALRNQGLIPEEIAEGVNFGSMADRFRRSREQERGDRGV